VQAPSKRPSLRRTHICTSGKGGAGQRRRDHRTWFASATLLHIDRGIQDLRNRPGQVLPRRRSRCSAISAVFEGAPLGRARIGPGVVGGKISNPRHYSPGGSSARGCRGSPSGPHDGDHNGRRARRPDRRQGFQFSGAATIDCRILFASQPGCHLFWVDDLRRTHRRCSLCARLHAAECSVIRPCLRRECARSHAGLRYRAPWVPPGRPSAARAPP
jgi:hypothetical protein